MQNKPIKYILYFFAVLFLLVISIIGYLLLNKQEIKNYALSQLNEQLDAKISINNIEIALFKQFPKVSLDMHLVRITDPTQPKQFLMQAEHVYVGFNIYDILRKQYKIKLIAIDSGQINLYTDLAGKSNYNILKPSSNTQQTDQAFLFSLNEVKLNQVNVVYINRNIKQHYDLRLQNILFSGDFSDKSELINCKGLVYARKIKADKFQFAKNKLITLDLALAINKKTDTYTFSKGFIDLDLLQLDLSGSISTKSTSTFYDLKVGARKLDIPGMLSLIPGNLNLPTELKSEGQLYFTGAIKGESSVKLNPAINFTFGVKNGKLQNGDGLSINDISFDGEFGNGKAHNAKSSMVKLDNLLFTLNNGKVKGNLLITDFTNPQLTTNLAGNMKAEDLVAFLKLKQLKQANGTISFDINFEGKLSNVSANNWLQNKASGSIDMALTNIVLEDNNEVKEFNASFNVNGKDVVINNLEATINQSDIKVSGTLKNLIPYLLVKNQHLTAQINYQSNHIDINNFAIMGAGNKDTINTGFSLPDNITISAKVSANKLVYNLFTAQNVSGKMDWHDKIIVVNDLVAQTMEGELKLDGQIENAPDGRFLITASTKLKSINMTRLFKECDDFGQKEITQKHVKGKLSGEINFVGVWSKTFDCDLNKLYALSKVAVSNGELINYQPLNALGKYIDVNELRNLKFADLNNTIEIKNKTIYIPQFVIQNNALNITLSGTHSFENFVDYKLKIKLSELLKNKRKKAHNEFNEEEATSDRGVNLYMSMKGPIDNVVITYDRVGAKQKITQEIKQEKQNIKDILKKELGIDDKKKSEIKEKQNDDDELEFEPE